MNAQRAPAERTRARSIRRRLFLQLAAVAALLSLAFFLAVRGVAQSAAEDTQDDILAASATAIADSLRPEGAGVTLELPYSALSMLGTINEDRVFYHVIVDGETLTGYSDLPSASPALQPGQPQFTTLDYRGDEVRSVSVTRFVGGGSQPANAQVTVAQTRLGMEAISSRISATATAIGVGFFLVATALSLLAARSALLPLNLMTGAVTRRGPQDLRPLRADTPTELVPFVDALNNFIARLRSSLLRSEEFIAEAAHRVRTPLATVRTQAEVVHRKLEDPDQKRALREMIRAIDESSRSAGQMLDHAMVTFRTDTLADDDVDLCELVKDTCDRLTPTADLKDIALKSSVATGPATLKGDAILLQSALANIIDNAIKYSPADSTISVTLDVNDELKMSVADEGRGFQGSDTGDLTTRFARGSNVSDIVGSGLGLTIADEVIRAHGGRLEIEQINGGIGACVSLILPRP